MFQEKSFYGSEDVMLLWKQVLLASKCAHIHSGEALLQRQKAGLYVGAGTRLYPLSSLWFHSDSHKQMFPFIAALTELESCESKASFVCSGRASSFPPCRYHRSWSAEESAINKSDNFLISFIFQVKQQSDNKQAEKRPKSEFHFKKAWCVVIWVVRVRH